MPFSMRIVNFYVVPKDGACNPTRNWLPASFLARKKRDNLIHSNAMAAVNLYGVILPG